MSPGVSIRTSFLPVLIAPLILHGSKPRCEDMVRYTEWASEGLAHHFAVESDELRLKTNIRGGPLSACLAHFYARRRKLLNKLIAACQRQRRTCAGLELDAPRC